ncbi:hypothetical protein GEMRC1_003744 [Eukaryota sp. GEM-RC1]
MNHTTELTKKDQTDQLISSECAISTNVINTSKFSNHLSNSHHLEKHCSKESLPLRETWGPSSCHLSRDQTESHKSSPCWFDNGSPQILRTQSGFCSNPINTADRCEAKSNTIRSEEKEGRNSSLMNENGKSSKTDLPSFDLRYGSHIQFQMFPVSELLKYKEELNSIPLTVKALIPSEVVESRLTTINSCETMVNQHPTKVTLLLNELQRDSFSIWLTALKESRVLTFFSSSFVLVDDLLRSSYSTFNVSRACLSYCYLKGIGCEKNEEKAISYYNKIQGFEKEKNIMSRFWINEVRSWISTRTQKQDLLNSYHTLLEETSLSSSVEVLLPNQCRIDIIHFREKMALIDSQNLDSNPSTTLLSECQCIWEGIQPHMDFLSSIKLFFSRFENLLSFFKSPAFNLISLKNECNSNNPHHSVLKLFTVFCYAQNLASPSSIEEVYRALDDVSLINYFPKQDTELISYWRKEVKRYTSQQEQILSSVFRKCISDIRLFTQICNSSLLKFVPPDLTLRVNFIQRTFIDAQKNFSTQKLSQKYLSVFNLEKQVVKAVEILKMFDILKAVPLSHSMTLFDYLTNTSFTVYTLTRILQTDQSQQTKEIVFSLLAFLYLKGIGTSQDYLEAGKYYQLLSPLEQQSNAIVSFWKEEVTKELTGWLKCKSELLEKSRSLQLQSKVITVQFLLLLPIQEVKQIKNWYVRVSQFVNDVKRHFCPSWDNFKDISLKLENEWKGFISLFYCSSNCLNRHYASQAVGYFDKLHIKCCLAFCYANRILVSPNPFRAKSLFDELPPEFINQSHGKLVQYWIDTLTTVIGTCRVSQEQSLQVNNSLPSVKLAQVPTPDSRSPGHSVNRTGYHLNKPSRRCPTPITTGNRHFTEALRWSGIYDHNIICAIKYLRQAIDGGEYDALLFRKAVSNRCKLDVISKRHYVNLFKEPTKTIEDALEWLYRTARVKLKHFEISNRINE